MSSDIKRNNHIEMAELRPGDVFTAEISGYTHDGWGVARLGQRVIFIQGALRGELVQAEISSQRRGVFMRVCCKLCSQRRKKGDSLRFARFMPAAAAVSFSI